MIQTPTLRTWDEGLHGYLRAENEHDIEGIMHSFANQAELVWGGQRYCGRAEIRRWHETWGFGNKGAFSGLQVIERHRHYSPSAIIVEQTLRGRHSGTWEGAAPTFKDIEIPTCTVFEFDRDGRLVSERAHLDRWLLWKQIQCEPSRPRVPSRVGGPTLRITM